SGQSGKQTDFRYERNVGAFVHPSRAHGRESLLAKNSGHFWVVEFAIATCGNLKALDRRLATNGMPSAPPPLAVISTLFIVRPGNEPIYRMLCRVTGEGIPRGGHLRSPHEFNPMAERGASSTIRRRRADSCGPICGRCVTLATEHPMVAPAVSVSERSLRM